MRANAVTGTLAAVVAALGLILAPAPTQAQASLPPMTRAEIIARAESAIGTSYSWGRESWTPNLGGGSGPDCSGYVLKCWQVPRTMLYQEEAGENSTISPRYTTFEFFNNLGPWFSLSDRSQLREGDILVKNNGQSGHVVIYAGGDAWNSPIVYEAPGTGQTISRWSRFLGSEYQPKRRNNLLASGIILDNPTARSTGGQDLAGNWTRSTSISGYYGHDYQVRAATTATSWARWTPRIPTSGFYNVYLRWTSGPNRASSARVHINTPGGQHQRWVNQQINGGAWFLLGRYQFGAGYSTGSGSVSIFATGADGWVVADAVMFSPTN